MKFWHCADDEKVSYGVTRAFVDRIKKNGGAAYLRTFPFGGHEPQLVGTPIKCPAGRDIFNGTKLEILPAVEEAFVWIRNFDN